MTHADFLRAVLADPADDTPRLVYADWLDERGDSRGEFIRVQCELAPFGSEPPVQPNNAGLSLERWQALRRRERELGSKYAIDWIPPAPDGWVAWRTDDTRAGWWPTDLQGVAHPEDNGVDFDFRRGFVAAVTLPAEAWLGGVCQTCHPPASDVNPSDCTDCHGTGRTPGHAAALLAACPLETVRLTTWPGYAPRLNRQAWVIPEECAADGVGVVISIADRENIVRRHLEKRWPGLRFELPATAEDDSLRDFAARLANAIAAGQITAQQAADGLRTAVGLFDVSPP